MDKVGKSDQGEIVKWIEANERLLFRGHNIFPIFEPSNHR